MRGQSKTEEFSIFLIEHEKQNEKRPNASLPMIVVTEDKA
jgi:hypothetical protein